MIIKKYFTLILIFINFVLLQVVNAQDLRVKILGENEPLPFAYISVNNRYIGMSDSLGIAMIPASELNLNDTVFVDFVGMDRAYAVYDKSVRSKNECLIKCKFVKNYIEAAVIIGQGNSMKRFKQDINFREVSEVRDNYRVNLKYREASESRNIECSGSMTIRYADENLSQRTWFYKITDAELDVDNAVYSHIATILWTALISKPQPYNVMYNEPMPKYIGEEEGRNIFSVTFAKNFVGQYLLKVNKKTKLIEEVETYNAFRGCIYKMRMSIRNEREITSLAVNIDNINMDAEMKNIKLDVRNIDLLPVKGKKASKIDKDFIPLQWLSSKNK